MRRVSVMFAWYDMWVGAYWSRLAKTLYICPLPMIVVRIYCGWLPRHGEEG